MYHGSAHVKCKICHQARPLPTAFVIRESCAWSATIAPAERACPGKVLAGRLHGSELYLNIEWAT